MACYNKTKIAIIRSVKYNRWEEVKIGYMTDSQAAEK